jgi:hypothetical protein
MTDYYVDGAVGNDGNLGTSEGAGNAFATITHALSVVAAGDRVFVKGSVVYNETATIVTPGSGFNYILIEGYTNTVGDNGQVIIDGQITRARGIDCTIGGAANYVIKNITCRNHTLYGFDFVSESSVGFWNCKAINNGNSGFVVSFSSSFAYCEARLNSNNGIDGGNTGRYYACVSANNSSYGYLGNSNATLYKCLAYENGLDQVQYASVNAAVQNTIQGLSDPADFGIDTASSTGIIADNIFTDNGTGLGISTTEISINLLIDNNLFFNNTANYENSWINNQFYNVHAQHDVIGDPQFVDAANEDYTLADSSPAINAGIKPGPLT